jgi:hypothetical protein
LIEFGQREPRLVKDLSFDASSAAFFALSAS